MQERIGKKLNDLIRQNGQYHTDINNFIFMQSTETYDKNKKEIFDGDIVLIKTWLNLFKHKGLVEFDRAAFRVLNEPINNWADIEIVGNKFENLDLYKEVNPNESEKND